MNTLNNTRVWLSISSIFLVATWIVIGASISPSTAYATELTVYKTPSCGCCQKWVDHVNGEGFSSNVVELEDLTKIKAKYQVGGRFRSCHTGVVVTEQGNYVFEGHVPAEEITRFLDNPPEGALGLSVPGMPIGSPGMEVGDRKDYYQVLLLNTDGSSEVFAHVNKPNP